MIIQSKQTSNYYLKNNGKAELKSIILYQVVSSFTNSIPQGSNVVTALFNAQRNQNKYTNLQNYI